MAQLNLRASREGLATLLRPSGGSGGGRQPRTGHPKQSELPASWSDDRIMRGVSDVITDAAHTPS